MFYDKLTSGCCGQVISCDQVTSGKARETKIEREVDEKFSYKFGNMIIEGKYQEILILLKNDSLYIYSMFFSLVIIIPN